MVESQEPAVSGCQVKEKQRKAVFTAAFFRVIILIARLLLFGSDFMHSSMKNGDLTTDLGVIFSMKSGQPNNTVCK